MSVWDEEMAPSVSSNDDEYVQLGAQTNA